MFGSIVTILVVLAHAAAILVVLLTERRQPSATLAWLLALIFLPGVGLLAYLLMGRPYARRVARRTSQAGERVREALTRFDVRARIEAGGSRPIDRRVAAHLSLARRLASTPPSFGNEARLLVDAAATYPLMIECGERAMHHLHVEFYIVQPDETGRALRDMLVRRARAGIEVRVLVDGVGSLGLPRGFWRPLKEAGGRAAVFRPLRNPFQMLRHRDRIDFRNHRKIVVADGRVGFTGGINIGREYLGLDPAMGAWRDTHVRLAGPAVLSLQQAFAEDWYATTGEVLADERFYPPPKPGKGGDCIVQVIDSAPDQTWSPIEYVHAHAFALAETRLWLTSPYFVPSRSITEGLIGAALRGVDVRLLLPSRSDSGILRLAARSYYAELMEAGARIFEYEPGFVHAKTLAVDDWLGVVGSANMDMRSFHLNFELSAFVYGKRFVEELAAQFETDLEHAGEIRLVSYENAPLPRRLLRGAARLFSPLL